MDTFGDHRGRLFGQAPPRVWELDGKCTCGAWSILVITPRSPEQLAPRVCDCGYCQAHPSAIISDPSMVCRLSSRRENLVVDTNGDGLASFYRCGRCDQLLAVGREINGVLRGAGNAQLLADRSLLAEATAIRPRLLAAAQKLARWNELWGTLVITSQ
ncbi:MAG TPA: hypothetical protein VJN18_27215 [Polyangiaceae bacterium]|nr:hypothetical protein [Polyangiaceae bacterium]